VRDGLCSVALTPVFAAMDEANLGLVEVAFVDLEGVAL
jgi:hypothetical protein